MREDDLLLPAGSRLLHIGPPKTGTTAIQGALMLAREAMAAHGVVYPGERRHQGNAVQSVLGASARDAGSPVSVEWESLVREVSEAGDRRVVVSSEAFAGAGAASVTELVGSLGGSRAHAIVTLRPLLKILPSTWQHQVRNRALAEPYEDWLFRMLDQRTGRQAKSFWRRHSHDEVVDRWASVVGVDNLTVVVVDETDRRMLMRTFERLLGLPDGLLEPDEVTNPSLSVGEIEALRMFNQQFSRNGWPAQAHSRFVRHGVVAHLLRSNRAVPGGQRIRTPAWAVECAAEIGSIAAEKIKASGVRVVGDVDSLGVLPDGYDDLGDEPPAQVSSEAMATALAGMMLALRSKDDARPRVARSRSL